MLNHVAVQDLSSDPPDSDIISIPKGEEVVQFSYKTYSPIEPDYPGIASIYR